MPPNIPIHPKLTITQASKLLATKKIKSSQLSKKCLNRAVFGEETLRLNAFTHLLSKDEILAQANLSDNRIRNNQRLSLLDGIPVTIKSNISVKGKPFTACSRILGEGVELKNMKNHNGMEDAYVVKRLLRDSGAVLIGLTNMDEFGMGSLGINVPNFNRVPRNPLPFLNAEENGQLPDEIDHTKFPHWSTGGSSSGAASSVAFGSCLLAIGTDTGGSVRLPSAWNGVVGWKPTYGWMSRHGVIEYASSLDTIGIISPSVGCAHLATNSLLTPLHNDHDNYQQMVGDATAIQVKTVPQIEQDMNLYGMRIGIPSSFSLFETPSLITEAWEASAAYLHDYCGASIVTLDDDSLSKEWIKQSLAAYYVLACAEASSNLSRYDGLRYGVDHCPFSIHNMEHGLSLLAQKYSSHRSTFFGDEVINRILCGNAVLSSNRFHTFYESAAKVRASLSKQFNQLFQNKVDVMLIPTSLSLPWDINQHVSSLNSTKTFENDLMTTPISLSCLPSISVPLKHEENLVGMQIFGPRYGEEKVLKSAACLEKMILK